MKYTLKKSVNNQKTYNATNDIASMHIQYSMSFATDYGCMMISGIQKM
jgi:hypothetical protein